MVRRLCRKPNVVLPRRQLKVMEKMVGMMPIKSTRFILSVRNLLLFGQTSSRRKYLALPF